MIRSILTAAAFATNATFAQAGDPCPIQVQIYDLGVPDWLDQTTLLAGLESRLAWLGLRYEVVESGVDVAMVVPGGPIDQAGISRDDTILSVNGKSDWAQDELADFFRTITPEQPLQLLVADETANRSVTVIPAPVDPVPLTLVQALHDQDCRTSVLRSISDDMRDMIRPALYDSNRRFRCDDAHFAIAEVHDSFARDDVFFLRGSRRIILSMPGWGTTCIEASALDGANLTQENALSIISPLIADYVADRHANP